MIEKVPVEPYQMIICNSTNITIQTHDNGLIFITKNCQLVETDTGNQTDSLVDPAGKMDDDSSGAVTYMIVVMLTYAVAVVGVFALSFLKRRKHYSEMADKEAHMFIKNIDHVRTMSEKKFRVGAVAALLEQVHADSKAGSMIQGASFLNQFAFATMSMAKIKEEQTGESDSTENDKPAEAIIYEENEILLSKDHQKDPVECIIIEMNGTKVNQNYLNVTRNGSINEAKETEHLETASDINSGYPHSSNSNSAWSTSSPDSTTEFYLADSDIASTDNEVFISDEDAFCDPDNT